jgi:hypothetical protein
MACGGPCCCRALDVLLAAHAAGAATAPRSRMPLRGSLAGSLLGPPLGLRHGAAPATPEALRPCGGPFPPAPAPPRPKPLPRPSPRAPAPRPDLLDPALLRPGRLDTLQYVGIDAAPAARHKVLQVRHRARRTRDARGRRCRGAGPYLAVAAAGPARWRSKTRSATACRVRPRCATLQALTRRFALAADVDLGAVAAACPPNLRSAAAGPAHA